MVGRTAGPRERRESVEISRRKLLQLGLVGLAGAGLSGCGPRANSGEGEQPMMPQYISVHKTDTGGAGPGPYWFQQDPSSVSQAGIEEILGGLQRGGANRRLAFAYSLSYLNFPLAAEREVLHNLLSLASANDLPLLIHLDGVNWWSAQSALWNWWDPSAPGYARDNVNNVEWYGPSAAQAVKLGWRDWGSQIRVSPQPNLASPRFLEAQQSGLEALIPPIVRWYRNLGPARRHLLAGVVLGWETSTYVNAYFYPNGNSYLEQYPTDATHDPRTGIQGSVPLGYAALHSLGQLPQGRPIQAEDIDRVVARYLGQLSGWAAGMGLPRGKLLTHTLSGTTIGAQGQPASGGMGSLTTDAMPGWSFYNSSPHAVDPPLQEIDGTPWGAVEFQPWGLSASLFEEYLGYRNCRWVDIFNWESIKTSPASLAAINAAVKAAPATLLEPALLLEGRVHGPHVTLSWEPDPAAVRSRLEVTRQPGLNVAGELATPSVLDLDVTRQRRHNLDLGPGTYQWTVVGTDASGARLAAEAETFTVA